jgi:hypothetical protein
MSASYSSIKGDLFYTGPDMIIHRCVREEKMYNILKACHDEPCGGDFADIRTSYKVLHSGYYCPTLFQDATRSMSKDVIASKGWVVLFQQMKFHSSCKFL